MSIPENIPDGIIDIHDVSVDYDFDGDIDGDDFILWQQDQQPLPVPFLMTQGKMFQSMPPEIQLIINKASLFFHLIV